MTATAPPPPAETPERRRNPFVVAAIAVALAFVTFMWIYAFFFASETGINRIDDRAWSERGEATCKAAKDQLVALADFRTLDDVGADALAGRADIVEQTNVILQRMLDELAATPPSDAKGARIVPRWLDDYRTYLADRVSYVARLRTGDGSAFSETEINGSPITNFIGDVARQNEMPSCQAPLDLIN